MWALFCGLLALNTVWAFSTSGPPARRQVPYQPFFVEQLRAGTSRRSPSLEDTVDGELERGVRYDPPGPRAPVVVESFRTQVPAFIDRAEPTELVSRADVWSTRARRTPAERFWLNLILGFGPTLLCVASFLWMMRRQASGAGMLGGFGRSTARQVTPDARVGRRCRAPRRGRGRRGRGRPARSRGVRRARRSRRRLPLRRRQRPTPACARSAYRGGARALTG